MDNRSVVMQLTLCALQVTAVCMTIIIIVIKCIYL